MPGQLRLIVIKNGYKKFDKVIDVPEQKHKYTAELEPE